MNELLLDQIPILSGMLRELEQLNIINAATNDKYNAFIVQ